MWRRFTIALRRTLAGQHGLSVGELGRRARVSFVKVAEFQRRGVVHFHALTRLDGPDDFMPAVLSVWGDDLARGVRDPPTGRTRPPRGRGRRGPARSTAAVALIEHMWAAPLTEALRRAGGSALDETWLAPADVAELERLIARRG